MLKKIFFFAFVCTIVGCQKVSVELNNNEIVSSDKLTSSSDYGDLPSEAIELITNGVEKHVGCEADNNRQFKNTSGLGTYAYPLTDDMKPIFLLHSALPCQPNIPYFLNSFVSKRGSIKLINGYSATFYLVKNPSYNSSVKVVDIDWDLNGQNNSIPVQSFTINNILIGQSNTVTCEVFSTDNKSSVYAQEMTFDFQISIDPILNSTVIEFGSGYSYACTNTGLTPIIAP